MRAYCLAKLSYPDPAAPAAIAKWRGGSGSTKRYVTYKAATTMAADRITIIKGDLGHIFVLSMNFVCGERRSTDPEMAAPVCLVIYLKPNGAEIQMSALGKMSAYGT
jgi:hypothetical protein